MKQTNLTLLILLILCTKNGYTQEWSDPMIVDLSNHFSDPQIVVDSGQLLHLAFEIDEDKDGYSDDIYYTNFNGMDWSPQINISSSNNNSQDIKLKLDDNENIHIMWGEWNDSTRQYSLTDILYTFNNGKAWAQPENLFHSNSQILYISGYDFDFDNKNHLHLLWSHELWLKYRYLQNGDSSDIKILRRGAFSPAFRIENDKIHATFMSSPEQGNNSVYYFCSHIDSIKTDSTHLLGQLVHTDQNNMVHFPQIVMDYNNRIHLLWHEGLNRCFWPNEIYHAYSDDGVLWSEAFDVTHNGGASFIPSIVVDSQNQVHIVWVQKQFINSDSSVYNISYAFFNGNSWSEPKNIFSKVNSLPCMAIDGEDFLHIVWRVWSETEPKKHYLYYSTTRPAIGVFFQNEKIKPKNYRLFQNFPNPFNTCTTITLSIPSKDRICLTIFNIQGKIVRRLISNSPYQPGNYSVRWDAADDKGITVSSGVYLCQLKSANYIENKKIILLF